MLTLGDIESLPATLGADETAELWGCSTWSLYAMAKAGSCPVAPLHLGRKLRWPTAPVLRSVGIEPGFERDEGARTGAPVHAFAQPTVTATASERGGPGHGTC